MSKKSAAPPAEEEWEDVEGEEGEEEEEEEDTTIANSDVMTKYKKAATWANEALAHVITLCKAGASVLEICKAGDDTINTKCATMFRGVEKGVAFPTCININQCVCHFSPNPGEPGSEAVLNDNDVVRIDLGVHIDGYCAVVAHTIVVTPTGDLPADGKEQQLITAAYATLNAASRQFRPGQSVYDVTKIIEDCAVHFGVNAVDGVLSHQMKRYIIDGGRCIPGKNVAEHKVHNYEFEPMSVWTLDVVLSTGTSRLRERDAKTTIFKTALESTYNTKLAAAAELQREIEAKFQTFPFCVRTLEGNRARLGLNEMLKHGNVIPYPVLFSREGEVLAQFKITILISGTKIERVTGIPMQKGGAAPAPFSEEALLTASKLPITFGGKKAKEVAAA